MVSTRQVHYRANISAGYVQYKAVHYRANISAGHGQYKADSL